MYSRCKPCKHKHWTSMQKNRQGWSSRLRLDGHFSYKFRYSRICCRPPSLLCLSCPLRQGWPAGNEMLLRGAGGSGRVQGLRGTPAPAAPRGEPRPGLPAGRRVPARADGSRPQLTKQAARLLPSGPARRERKHCQSMHILRTVGNLIADGAEQGFDGCLSLVSDFSGSCKGPGLLPAASA